MLANLAPAQLTTRFGRSATAQQCGSDHGFQIHLDKLNYELLERLLQLGLAWPTHRKGRETAWFSIHPDLGEAIVSVIAIAAARRNALDIVTDSAPLHAALAALDEQQVLNGLLRPFAPPSPPTAMPAQVVDQLGHIIMTTMIDLEALSMKDVAEIVHDGEDLTRFREAIASMAIQGPPDAAPDVRQDLLRERAEAIVDQWNEHRKSLPKKLREALRATTAEHSGKALEDAGKAIGQAAGAGGTAGMGALLSTQSFGTAVLSAGVGFGATLLTVPKAGGS